MVDDPPVPDVYPGRGVLSPSLTLPVKFNLSFSVFPYGMMYFLSALVLPLRILLPLHSFFRSTQMPPEALPFALLSSFSAAP
jgi:hypothetical protein